MMRAFALAASLATAAAHAGLMIPSPRNANDKDLPMFSGGKSPQTPCTCANGLPAVAPPKLVESVGTCWTGDFGYNYNNHAHQLKVVPGKTTADCCSACTALKGCKFYTFVEDRCYLKSSDVGRTPLKGAVSGGIGAKPAHFPSAPAHSGGVHGECDQGLREGGGGQPCLWWSQGCSIGCAKCVTDLIGPDEGATGNAPHVDKIGFRKRYCNATYNAGTLINSTLPRAAWTMNVNAIEGSEEDSYRFNPWRAPGAAPVVDPCGMAGGKGPHQGIGGDSAFTTTPLATMGDHGSVVLKETPQANKTRWAAGTSVEVGWGIRYNHGGGYQYRLCPKHLPLTEECFQKMPLEFDRTIGTSLVWNNGTRYPIKNVFVSEGTIPKGSTWARNPIPRVNDDNKGLADASSCPGPSGTSGPGCMQFPAPCPQDHGREPWSTDGSGQGACSGDWTAGLIVDRVIIPKDITPGDYVLGWRWDCEETAQIWQNCADVVIQKA